MQSRYRTGGLELRSQAVSRVLKSSREPAVIFGICRFTIGRCPTGDVLAITYLEMTNRASFASGESSGDVGAYEFLERAALYAVDL